MEMDFSGFTEEGEYRLPVRYKGMEGIAREHPEVLRQVLNFEELFRLREKNCTKGALKMFLSKIKVLPGTHYEKVGLFFLAAFIVMPLFADSAETSAETSAAISVERWDRMMNERIPDLMAKAKVPGLTIALISEGHLAWSGAYGYADLENKIPMTIDMPCRVESISKSVTAWGVMKLVEEGRIDMDSPVSTYLGTWSLPDSPYDEGGVTVRRLLSQTSGMPLGTIGVRYSPEGDIPPLEKHLAGEAVLVREPGSAFSYSNSGFNLLELMIEKTTGEDFSVYMSREILRPLGMEYADFNWNREWDPGVPNGYDLRGRPIPVYVYPDRASGGLFAPVEDVAAFVAAGMKGLNPGKSTVLGKESIRALYETRTKPAGYYSLVFDGYGFGHFIETLPDGKLAVSHGGQGSGWMTHFHSIPETGDGIVILANSQRSWPLFSAILTNWASWTGHGSVGMGIIARGARLLRILLAANLFLIALTALQVLRGIKAGHRRFRFPLSIAPFSAWQGAALLSSLGLTFGVLVVSRMEYFFLSSVFPAETPWLGAAMLLWAAVLLVTLIFPKTLVENF